MLDAGPIIGLHELGIWSQFTQRYEVVVPQVVYEDEALALVSGVPEGLSVF